MRHWIFLMVSGLFEVAWIVSLKCTDGFSRAGPTVLYAVTGLGAAFFLSLSLKSIPMGTAYAVWMGFSVVGVLLIDAVFFNEPWNALRVGCALLILAGTCGLKLTSTT
jgi:quaternary ammonium compound-resistance protein SugE